MNGKTLAAETNGTGNQELFLVKGTLNVTNGTITVKHVGDDLGWSAMTTAFDITAGGVLNLEKVIVKNLGGSSMAFCVHMNNWGEVTLTANKCTFESTYVAIRVFNSGPDMNNVTITNSNITGGNYAVWVHNYTSEDFGGKLYSAASASYDEAKVQERLNFNIFNGTNTFTASTAAARYGFTNSIKYDANGNVVS